MRYTHLITVVLLFDLTFTGVLHQVPIDGACQITDRQEWTCEMWRDVDADAATAGTQIQVYLKLGGTVERIANRFVFSTPDGPYGGARYTMQRSPAKVWTEVGGNVDFHVTTVKER